jgi:hypothetical protein
MASCRRRGLPCRERFTGAVLGSHDRSSPLATGRTWVGSAGDARNTNAGATSAGCRARPNGHGSRASRCRRPVESLVAAACRSTLHTSLQMQSPHDCRADPHRPTARDMTRAPPKRGGSRGPAPLHHRPTQPPTPRSSVPRHRPLGRRQPVRFSATAETLCDPPLRSRPRLGFRPHLAFSARANHPPT